jgi:hypothetical protein
VSKPASLAASGAGAAKAVGKAAGGLTARDGTARRAAGAAEAPSKESSKESKTGPLTDRGLDKAPGPAVAGRPENGGAGASANKPGEAAAPPGLPIPIASFTI